MCLKIYVILLSKISFEVLSAGLIIPNSNIYAINISAQLSLQYENHTLLVQLKTYTEQYDSHIYIKLGSNYAQGGVNYE